MGKIVHLDKVREFMRRTPAFRARDVEMIVNDGGYAALLLHNLAKRGEVKRITKGWYTVHDDPLVSVFGFKPAYIGLQEALSLRELWEQESNVVLVTALRVRPGVRRVMGSNVVLHRMRDRYVFGFDYLKYGEFMLPVSDREKTLIDLVYFNESPGGRVMRRIAKGADKGKLNRYLQSYPKAFRRRVRRILG